MVLFWEECTARAGGERGDVWLFKCSVEQVEDGRSNAVAEPPTV